ncbi:hypothetical protein K432DRAFT_399580 [Lepidopterella palustris CBS 459.81]|uniref:Uncharacterized protein n=1 Tax=Lepidopterella palustris CBS 459.81 TaxID=1314670 RepID=A0A8E2EMA6_9PEZI|nr:hypothetical protein K432DRAFT_399580 [Lepidopterella palustris CBS 459.81]
MRFSWKQRILKKIGDLKKELGALTNQPHARQYPIRGQAETHSRSQNGGTLEPGHARAGEHPIRNPRGPPPIEILRDSPTANHEGSPNFAARARCEGQEK